MSRNVLHFSRKGAPEAYWLNHALMSCPAMTRSSSMCSVTMIPAALYPRFQEYFARHRPPPLAFWGRHHPFFLPAGAEAFRRDNPNAEMHLLDTGHFALETHAIEIADSIRSFLGHITA